MLTLRWIALGASLLLSAVAVGTYQTPLERLEAETLAIPTWHTDYRTPEDDTFYWEARQLEGLIGRLFRLPVDYGRPIYPGAAGVLHEDRIVIDDRLRWTARLETLAHEAGHLFMPNTMPPQSSESEVFAEAVSHLVCRALGHDNVAVSARYLARHKQALDVLRTYGAEITWAAETLTVAW